LQNHIKICGHYYEVRFVENLTDSSGDRHAWGRIHPGKQVIEIELNSTSSKKKESLIHEIIHAIESSVDLGLSELEICVLANALFQLGLGDLLIEKLDIPML
tara:strand:- start:650 stop:955 length:306 start_codon:yes stop_codon:yes gene_type:complete